MPRPVAYLDESFHEGGPLGFYVLAAAVLATELDQARDAMRALRGGRRTNKLHWNEIDERVSYPRSQPVRSAYVTGA